MGLVLLDDIIRGGSLLCGRLPCFPYFFDIVLSLDFLLTALLVIRVIIPVEVR